MDDDNPTSKPPVTSPDGKSWWDGTAWRPLTAGAAATTPAPGALQRKILGVPAWALGAGGLVVAAAIGAAVLHAGGSGSTSSRPPASSSDSSQSDAGTADATQACNLQTSTADVGARAAAAAAAASPRYTTLSTYWSELAGAAAAGAAPPDLNAAQSAEVQENAAKALVISECHSLGISTPGVSP